MVYVTQFIYVHDGREATFDAFEAVALPIIAKYNGRLLMRCRPPQSSMLELDIEAPYEIHLVEFTDEADLQAFFRDEERKQYVHLKEESVRVSWLLQGTAPALPPPILAP